VILIPHVILAGLMTPFILIAVWFALKGKFDKHKRLVKWVFPVWLFVSLSGVFVYLMLYHL
jgi:putative membrane protein